MPRYWSITQYQTGDFTPGSTTGQGVIDASFWGKNLYGSGGLIPILYCVSWYADRSPGTVRLELVANEPENGPGGYGPANVHRIVLFEDASGLITNFVYDNNGEGRRIPFVGSREARYSLLLTTTGIGPGIQQWTSEIYWAYSGLDPQCP